MSKLSKAKWNTLSTGEKVLRVVLGIVKAVLFLCGGAVILVIIAAFWVAAGLMGGITGAVNDEVWRSRTRNW